MKIQNNSKECIETEKNYIDIETDGLGNVKNISFRSKDVKKSGIARGDPEVILG